MTPKLVIISAPSGAGKSTLCDRLLQDYPELVYSVSCTTREPRGEEEDGVDYHFLTREVFEQFVGRGDFLEYAEVHGNYYGTLASPIRAALDQGLSVLLDIDVEGADQVRNFLCDLDDDDPLKDALVDIFISPPSMEELRRRLEGRGEDAPEVIEKRLRNAIGEMNRQKEFRFNVVNDDLEIAYRELVSILEFNNAVIGPGNTEEEHKCRCGGHGHGSCGGHGRHHHEHGSCDGHGHNHGHEHGSCCCGGKGHSHGNGSCHCHH